MKFYVILGAIIIVFVALFVFRLGETPTPPMRQVTAASVFDGLIGKPAPNFILPDLNGKVYNLADIKGKDIILFFSEGIMCYPACWNQIAELGTDTQLNNGNVASFSVVPDTLNDWQSASHQMPALAKGTILLDTDTATSNVYGTLNLPSSMHKGMKPGHSYVVIDKSGIVRYVLDDPTMNIQNTKLKQEITKI